MSTLILAYNKYSASAKQLKQHILLLKPEIIVKIVGAETWMGWTPSYRKQFLIKNKIKRIVNWGCKDIVFTDLNIPEGCIIANRSTYGLQNKLDFFKLTQQGGNKVNGWLPQHTQDPTKVVADIIQTNSVWVGRKYLNASCGKGIKFYNKNNYNQISEDGAMPLYTKYIPKQDEFRVHFCINPGTQGLANGPIFFIQKKKLKKEHGYAYANLNAEAKGKSEIFKIRNLDHGWVFSSNLTANDIPGKVKQCASAVALKLGQLNLIGALKFGAIDIIYNSKDNAAYALECNSAPGLCETTAKFYAKELTA